MSEVLFILFRTVMSWHYYCWALGYAHEGEFDPVLRVVCDDVSIEKKYWLWSHKT